MQHDPIFPDDIGAAGATEDFDSANDASCHEVGSPAVTTAKWIQRGKPRVQRSESRTLAVIPQYVPFPVRVLPGPIRRFVCEVSTAMGCDPAFVALPALAVTASAIGMTREIQLRAGWTEPCIIWAIVIARSGTLKSPAHDAAVKPLLVAQIDMMRKHDAAAAEHENTLLHYEADLAAWKKKREGEPPIKPVAPIARRIIVNDVTVEALAPILEGNPRGTLLARDESSGWLRGLNQYKGGKGGDEAAWLELHRGGTLITDRKTGTNRTIIVPHAAVSVCGGIQPGVFDSIMKGTHTESGLVARLLMARPPVYAKVWTERGPSQAAIDGYRAMLAKLLPLDFVSDEEGRPEPLSLALSAEAQPIWANFFNRHAQRTHAADSDREAAAFAKLEGYAARLALVFTLAEDPWATEVNAESLRRAVQLAEWFAHETERIYASWGETPEDRKYRELADWIDRHGGTATARELSRGPRAYRKAEGAEAALNELVNAGLGYWEPVEPDGAGRPSRRFRLLRITEKTGDSGDGDEIPEKLIESPNCVTVASVATCPNVVTGAEGDRDDWGEV